jgi:hypothetical protein
MGFFVNLVNRVFGLATKKQTTKYNTKKRQSFVTP